jgi:hypothetical protein
VLNVARRGLSDSRVPRRQGSAEPPYGWPCDVTNLCSCNRVGWATARLPFTASHEQEPEPHDCAPTVSVRHGSGARWCEGR